MSIENERQLENTQAKLRELELLYQRKLLERQASEARQLTLQSLKKRIGQFKEEIADYRCRAKKESSEESPHRKVLQ